MPDNAEHQGASLVGGRLPLRPDCERCLGLCCVAPAFSASADFAIDKEAGQPCPNLQSDTRCGIHDQLRQDGFSGCVVYDCFGAGQHATQTTFAGKDWRDDAETATQMLGVFPIMRQLHELLWYLTEALTLPSAHPFRGDLAGALEGTERLTELRPEELARLDVGAHRGEVSFLLARVSERVRAGAPRRGRDHRGADLIGADLAGADLRGADLRGALLVGAHLGGADLRWADVIGADLRGADLVGADLRESLFLTQSQLEAATGDTATMLPSTRTRPAHW